jgi:hypothetical protein
MSARSPKYAPACSTTSELLSGPSSVQRTDPYWMM